MKSFVLIQLFFLLFILPAHAKAPTRVIEGVILKVTDGDTIQLQDKLGSTVRIRLYGIDAPETEKVNLKTGRISKEGQPYGQEAFKTLRGKVGGQAVKAEVMDIDRYRRAVSVVRYGNRNINQEMVREGFAWAYRQYLDRPHASEYIQAEEQARREKRGLWQQSNPQPPWEFRQMQRKGHRQQPELTSLISSEMRPYFGHGRFLHLPAKAPGPLTSTGWFGGLFFCGFEKFCRQATAWGYTKIITGSRRGNSREAEAALDRGDPPLAPPAVKPLRQIGFAPGATLSAG